MENASLSFDKRKHPRVKIQIPVKYKLVNQSQEALAFLQQMKTIQSGDSRDLSEEGLFMIGDRRLAQGDILKVEVFLPVENLPIRAFCEVAWSSEEDLPSGRHGAGLYFMALRDEDQARMRRFVDETLAAELY